MNTLLKSTLVLAMSVAFGATTAHAGSGGSPNGKPFVAINGALVEVQGVTSSLQDQIDALVASVDTLEGLVGANQTAIATLQSQNQALSALVQQNVSDIASIEAEILALQQANADLQDQIAANSGDIATLQEQVAENTGLIVDLQEAINLVNNSIISLETSLQTQIDNNLALILSIESEIDAINDQLALKQNLVNGICPDGSAIQQIFEDGSVFCEGVSGASGQLQSGEVIITEWVNPGITINRKVYCPDGWVATGAGYAGFDFAVSKIHTGSIYGRDFAHLRARNDKAAINDLHTVATCTRIIP